LPRVDPQLHNWVEPYSGVEGLRLHVFDTGSMVLPQAAVFRGGAWFTRLRMNVPAFVVEHPSGGLIVFDTGVGPHAASQWLATLGMLNVGTDLTSQMRRAGLEPDRVTHVVLSHLHFDHTGGVPGFRNATVVSARGEQAAASAAGALGFYDEADWQAVGRWIEIDYASGEPYATFISHHDLLGDGSIVLVDLHGHTAGSQGMVVRAPRGPVLLTGDAAWIHKSWRYAARPISADDMDAWWDQIWRIRKLAQLVPSLLVVAGHDLSTLLNLSRDDLVVHDVGGGAEVTASAR
jgi:glyoxylase-like metal-dependent hydrolase (beta-lactamase superfamily II)